MSASACDDCLRRAGLIEQLGGNLDFHARHLLEILDLNDDELLALPTGALRARLRDSHRRFTTAEAERRRRQAAEAGLQIICRCDPGYPSRLLGVPAAPAVLHVFGELDRFLELCAQEPVALVGCRRATEYGRDVSALLGRGISASGLTVISGMAPGIDSSAHDGALAAGGRTIAVLPGTASVSYPRSNRRLHERIVKSGAVISECGPGTSVRRWMLPARNRIIAALAEMTVVVQAGERSGVETTVAAATTYGRLLGAVPGSVLLPQSHRPNRMLAGGAVLISRAQDVLDAVYGAGARLATDLSRPSLKPGQQAVVEAIASGADTIAALSRTGIAEEQLLTVLAGLELSGSLRRETGGRYVLIS